MPLRASAQTAPKSTSPTGNTNGEAADFEARAQSGK
jgi:catalase